MSTDASLLSKPAHRFPTTLRSITWLRANDANQQIRNHTLRRFSARPHTSTGAKCRLSERMPQSKSPCRHHLSERLRKWGKKSLRGRWIGWRQRWRSGCCRNQTKLRLRLVQPISRDMTSFISISRYTSLDSTALLFQVISSMKSFPSLTFKYVCWIPHNSRLMGQNPPFCIISTDRR